MFLSIVIIFCILWIYDGFLKEYIQKRQEPKFRSAEYGWTEYYSPYFKCWRPFYIWSDIDKERKIHIIDRIREIEFDYKYIGEGRERIDYDIQRKLWQYFQAFCQNNPQLNRRCRASNTFYQICLAWLF